MLEKGLLDEQAAEQVRMRLAEGKTLDQALLAGGLLEERVPRFPTKEFQCPYVELEQCDTSKEFLS